MPAWDRQSGCQSLFAFNSRRHGAGYDLCSCISNDGAWNGASSCFGQGGYESYKKWLKQNDGLFNSSMVSNIMDYLDTVQMDEREFKRA